MDVAITRKLLDFLIARHDSKSGRDWKSIVEAVAADMHRGQSEVEGNLRGLVTFKEVRCGDPVGDCADNYVVTITRKGRNNYDRYCPWKVLMS